MSFLQKVIDQVSVEVRQDGVKCRGKGEVQVTRHTDAAIDAVVTCGRRVRVSLNRIGLELQYGCECDDYFETGEPCQHVWATLLVAEAQGHLHAWDTRGRVEMVPLSEVEADAEEEGGEDEGDDERDDDDDHDRPMTTHNTPTEILPALAAKLLHRSTPPGAAKGGGKKAEDWKAGFELLRQVMGPKPQAYGVKPWSPGRELLYVIDVGHTLQGDGLSIELMVRDRKKDGAWGKPKHESLSSEDVPRLPDVADQEIVALLGGARSDSYGYYSSYYAQRTSRYRLQEAQYATMVRRMCETGRCHLRLRPQDEDLVPIAWDETVWTFVLKVERDDEKKQFVLHGELRADGRVMQLEEALLLVHGGLAFTRTHASRFDHRGAFSWIILLRKQGKITVPAAQGEELLEQLLTLPEVPEIELPEDLKFERQPSPPKPRLVVKKPKQQNSYYYGKPKLIGELSFEYEGQVINADDASPGVYVKSQRRLVERDRAAERDAAGRLYALGFRQSRSGYYSDEPPHLELAPSHLPNVVRQLVAENWRVEADGSLYRQAGNFSMEVTSGIDWFELHGKADFDGQTVALPDLLKALRRGEKTIRLDDGTFGVLPEQWLQKYGLLAGMGEEKDDHVKFTKQQVGLLDALLASQPEVNTDAVFEQARQRLRDFSGVSAAEAPETFVGTLRPYQREGLGWLEFLRRFGFGGCLADDMGLGKTVQVLALLEDRRLRRIASAAASSHDGSGSNGDGKVTTKNGEGGAAGTASEEDPPAGPSLVIAPRSLVFNWREEANRFAPNLRVLDHTGIARMKNADEFKDYDLILTTYGTMRNDIAFLKDVRFDYVVLDEAQAVKNAASESAKAARLLGGTHRLALSGTPVQNHLGELWSLFEFLNPGMLGAARAFQSGGAGAKVADEQARVLLSRALRPFILRRTKGQVAKELPQRVEQTIHCELDTVQRKLYDDLKEHYRKSLLTKIAAEGINKNKIQVLEALLRLRQAACHPGLIDKERTDESSAKLDALLPQLAEVTDGGHKALVFSQFTSFLSIVRKRLDKNKTKYVYLDGRTRDRQAVVEEFQKSDDTRLFLISLKAGGVGLNLTAAEYVFLLDPWWNPAVEAQAIDRAHRIGQTRQVFAYRLIAKDTVEEKVLQLQATKRELADAIINADNSLISKLGREDLELLLS